MEDDSHGKEPDDLNLDDFNFNKKDENVPTLSGIETNNQKNDMELKKTKKVAPPMPVFGKPGKK
jgi:hypothetical protein